MASSLPRRTLKLILEEEAGKEKGKKKASPLQPQPKGPIAGKNV